MGSNTTCGNGLQFYFCEANDFRGCCSVDPCDLPGCPEDSFPQASSLVLQALPATVPSKTRSRVAIASTNDDRSSSLPPTNGNGGPTISDSVQTDVDNESGTRLDTPMSTFETSTGGHAALSLTILGNPVVVFVTPYTFVSPRVTTPVVNGHTLAPTTIMVTSTKISWVSRTGETDRVSQSLFPDSPVTATAGATGLPPSNSPSGSPSTKTTIGIVFGAIGGLAVIGFLLWRIIRWRLRKRKNTRRAGQHFDHPALQGRDANRAGEVFDKEDSRSHSALA